MKHFGRRGCKKDDNPSVKNHRFLTAPFTQGSLCACRASALNNNLLFQFAGQAPSVVTGDGNILIRANECLITLKTYQTAAFGAGGE